MFGRRKPQLTREQSLSAIPLRNQAVDVRRETSGNAVLVIKRSRSWWVGLLARVTYVPDERKISLDELGTYVWDLCDGQTTVKSIISQFARKHKLGRKEAEVSVVEYMRQLARKGLIGLMVPKPKEAGEGKGGKKKRAR